VSFQTASALELPFDHRRRFQRRAVLQHVAMNIREAARGSTARIRRVLKSGGRFATFDVVLNGARRSNRPVSARWCGKTTPRPPKPGIAQLRASGPPHHRQISAW